MAKLDVRVIDMTGGEITKIAYEGAEYVKTTEKPRTGDIGLRLYETVDDIAYVGNYYLLDMKRIEVGYICEDGDFVTTSRASNFAYFRKVSADNPSLDSRVDSLESRMSEVEAKVDGGELAPGTIVRGKKSGDYYVIGERQPCRDDVEGKAYGVGGPYYTCENLVEVVTPIEGPAQVGDKIVIVNADTSSGNYENGDVMTVTVSCNPGAQTTDKHEGYIGRYEFVIVERTEAKPYEPSEGDIVVITGDDETVSKGSVNSVGDIGKVVKEGDYGLSVGIEVPGRITTYKIHTSKKEVRPATPSEIAQYEKDAAKANKPKVGEYVKAVKNMADWGRKEYVGYSKGGQGVINIGQFGKVVDVLSDRIVVDFEGASGSAPAQYRSRFVLIDGEYERASDEEVAEAIAQRNERTITAELAKYGRKPGEFKEGDIVRYIGKARTHGALIEVCEDTRGIKTKIDVSKFGLGICSEVADDIELITPVEARIDRIAETA